MGSITFAAFVAAVKSRVSPFGTAENLDGTITEFVGEALTAVQRYVDCFQFRHVDVFDANCSAVTSCGVTYIAKPRGKVVRVRNRRKDDDLTDSDSAEREAMEEDHCDIFDYDFSPFEDIKEIGLEMKDLDLSKCRLRWGCACVGPANIAISPPLQCGEQIEVEWNGIKRSYADSDLVPDDPELKAAVVFYVQKELARQYDHDLEAANTSAAGWNDMLAELAHDCREHGVRRTEVPEDEIGAQYCFSFVSDGGLVGLSQRGVASLIEWINPDALLFGGDNNYPNGDPATIASSWRVYGDAINRSAVFPALGDHDLNFEDGKPQTSFFRLPKNGRYYSFRRGPVEFFCINSGLKTDATLVEPDGNSSTSTQAQWLQAALAASEAPWKVVYFHHAPYTNAISAAPGNTTMRWDFKGWGADVVLSGHGHNYERLVVNDFPYFVVGTGGAALEGFSGTANGSRKQASEYGALRVVADRQKLIFRFYSSAQELLDVYGLGKCVNTKLCCEQNEAPAEFGNTEQTATDSCEPMPLEHWTLNEEDGDDRVGTIAATHLVPEDPDGVTSVAGKLDNATDATVGLYTDNLALFNYSGTAMSVTGWLKMVTPGDSQDVFRWESSDAQQLFRLYTHTDGHLSLSATSFSGGSGTSGVDTDPLDLNTWYFFSASYDPATGKATLTINNGTPLTDDTEATCTFAATDDGYIGFGGSADGDIIVDQLIVRKYLPAEEEVNGLWNGGVGFEPVYSATITVAANTYTAATQEDADALALESAESQAAAAVHCPFEESITAKLAGYWKLDVWNEIEGGTLSTPDSLGRLDLDDSNSSGNVAPITDGKIAGGVSCLGIHRDFGVQSFPALTPEQRAIWNCANRDFTLRLWFRFGGAGNDDTWLTLRAIEDPACQWIFTYLFGTNKIRVKLFNQVITHDTAITPNVWHRLILSRGIGASEVHFKVDDEATQTVAYTGSDDLGPTLQYLVIGHASNGVDFDEVAIWQDYVLTEDDMTYDWNGGAGRTFPLT